MTSPSRILPTRNTTARSPGEKSLGWYLISEMNLDRIPRNGMTSPNGTSFRLT